MTSASVLEVARGGRVIAELDRELDELAQHVGIAGRDVVRGLERGERVVELAGARARARGIAQRQRAGRARPSRGRSACPRRADRRRGAVAARRAAARARRRRRSPRSRAARLERRRARRIAHRLELRVVERRRPAATSAVRGELALARDERGIDAGVARQLAGELREPAGRRDELAVARASRAVT